MKCSWGDCTEPATHKPKVCVQAMGWPIEGHRAAGVTLGLNLCLNHCKAFDAKGFLECKTPAGGGTNKVIFDVMTRGKCPPDYARVYVQPIPLDCEESLVLDGANKSIPPAG